MTVIGALVALVAQATAPVTPVVDAEGFSTQETEVLATSPDAAERMTLPITIGEHGPYRFFVDTGSQATVISRQIERDLSLVPDGTATLVGVASKQQVRLAQLDGLQLGSRTINGLSAPVLDRRHMGADGIIGLDTLQDLKVLLDFQNNRLAVVESASDDGSGNYEIVVRARSKLGRLIVTDASIDGVRTTIIVDTGSQASIGNLALLQRLRKGRQESVVGHDVNGGVIDARLNSVRAIRIGNAQLSDIPIAFSDALVFEELGIDRRPALILGMQDMKLFDRVAIDFGKQRILFDVPDRFRSGSMHRLGKAGAA